MKLSQIKGYEDTEGIYYFLKFSELKYLRDIQNGNLYMNNFKYFKVREEQDKKKGLGDRYDGSFVMHDLILDFYDSETKEYFGNTTASQMTINSGIILSKPVFCTTYITSEDLLVNDEAENEFIVSIDTQFLERMEEDFGAHALIINAFEFTNRAQSCLNEDRISYIGSKVKYRDFSKNDRERFLSFGKKKLDMFFWKDIYFQYQQEHRLVILQDHYKPFVYNIGNIEEHTELVATNDLKTFNLRIIKKK